MSESEKFRSPVAVVIWWLWVLFAVGNLIDLAIQGSGHLSVVAAFVLLLITGVVYVMALRPKIVADADGLTLTNPVRVHRIAWTAIAEVDTTDLLRVRCEWPAGGDGQTARRVIYSWAVHTSRRRQVAAEMRAQRVARRTGGGGSLGSAGSFGGIGGIGGFGGLGGMRSADAPPPAPVGLDARQVVAALSERAEAARTAEPGARAVPPASAWHWPAVAAVAVPALALLIAALA